MSFKEGPILPDKQSQLITGCLAGDRSCQSALYTLYAPKMMVVCLRFAKNREEAEEILQDGFMKVFKFVGQFKGNGSFEGWIRKIMVNCALHKLKSELKLRPVVLLDEQTNDYANTENILSQINGKELLVLVQKLSPVYRTVFNLFVFEGMKHREIAVLLNISEGTSKSNLSAARSVLQSAITTNLRIAKQRSHG